MRMSMRRFARLTNAFSKKRQITRRWWHSTSCITTSGECITRFGVTPAMEAGIADRVWSIEEIVALLG
jgi:hypothetical protein